MLLLIHLFLACDNQEPEKKKVVEKSEAEELQERINSIENILKNESEKINLLAEFHRIPFDTLNSILRDYLVFTSIYYNKDETRVEKYKSSISKLNLRYKISKSKLASLIFNYKFEMITKEEIEDKAIEYYLENYDGSEEMEEPDQRDPWG